MKSSPSLKALFLVVCCFLTLNVFGACPFSEFTDVVTACTGANDLGVVYPAGTSKREVASFPLRPNKRTGMGYTHGIGCVDETPSPAWFAIKIDQPGNLLMNISHSEGADVDFVCWGPFKGESKQEMLENVCANSDKYFADCVVPNTSNTCKLDKLDQCESQFAVGTTASQMDIINAREKISKCKAEVEERSKLDTDYECFYGKYDAFPISQMSDCSFSKNTTETCYLENVKSGDWYLILVTNFSGKPGNILFTAVDGSATTDCSVVVDAGSNSPVCEGEYIDLFVNNLPAYATCKWTGPNGFVSDEISPKILGVKKSDAGVYYVQVTTHDGLQSEEIPVPISVIPNSPIDTVIKMVEGSSVTFMNVELSKSGNYMMTSKKGQCEKIYNVKVIVEPLLSAYIEQNGPICEGDSLILSVVDAPTDGVEGYIWTGPNGFRSYADSPVVLKMNQSKAGEYYLHIQKEGLSFPVAPVNVEVISKIREKVFQRIPYGDTFEFAGEEISQRGTYFATFESANGCDSVVELMLVHEMPELVPDPVLTPNGDGVNDVWSIKNIEIYPEAVVRIFDRFGKCLYQETEYSQENAFVGKDQNGRELPSSDYWYSIDVQTSDRTYFGHFSLVRSKEK